MIKVGDTTNKTKRETKQSLHRSEEKGDVFILKTFIMFHCHFQ